MIATFYKNNSDNMVVNKDIAELFTLDNVLWKEATNEFEPSITFHKVDKWRGANYVKMNMYGVEKYFYIQNLTLEQGGILRADLKCDVLMTYKTYIKGLHTIVTRQEHKNNKDIIDNQIAIPTNREITTKSVGTVGSDNASIVVTVSN
ncbi:MAG: hypothetical protein Q4A15_01030 [Prevotellaceae bacterium]|nr:hypothetical protein [Prevotellaceae bacterium]